MKKSLVALAALAVAGVASAQSSVTLFGVVDAAVSGYSTKSDDRNTATLLNPFYQNQGSVRLSRTVLSSSGYNSSRLGFRGTEDLGGGLAASFWLEAGLTNDDGNGAATGGGLNFNRRSTVSLSGGFGEIRLGRDYTPSFWNDTVFDPFGTNGVGTNLISTANGVTNTGGAGGFGGNANSTRSSNSVGYFLPPNLGGFYGQVMYAFHENTKYSPGTATPPGVNAFGVVNAGAAATTRAGGYVGGRFGYANGPLDVAVAYGRSTVADQYYIGTTDYVKTANLGASYDFGVVKLFGEVSRARNERDNETFVGARPDQDVTGYLVGVTVPVGAGLIRASYSHVKYDLNLVPVLFAPTIDDAKADKFALGYVHNLSKRTALYATVARVNNKNGAALTVGGPAFINNATFTPKTSTGYDFGIRHAF